MMEKTLSGSAVKEDRQMPLLDSGQGKNGRERNEVLHEHSGPTSDWSVASPASAGDPLVD